MVVVTSLTQLFKDFGLQNEQILFFHNLHTPLETFDLWLQDAYSESCMQYF